ncbi:TerB domain-containing protein [Gammaproteobacteria bacterium]
MGLFDMFRNDSGAEMTPHLAFVIALLYMMSADGEIDNEEVGHLLSVLGGKDQGNGVIGVGSQNQELLNAAIKYRRNNTIDAFLKTAVPLLSDAQKICILINLLDSSLSDGTAEPEEQALFGKFLNAFGINEDRFRPFFQVIAIKNDRSVFTDKNHRMNQPGYEVRLSGIS